MRILSITAQKPNSTGSGVYLTELVKGFALLGHEQAVIAGVYRQEPVELPEHTVFYPVCFGTEALPFPVVGMSDEMPYESTVYGQMTPKMTRQFKEAFAAQIARAAREFKPDVVLCHHLYLVTALARELLPRMKVFGFCHNTDLRQMRKIPLEREYIREQIQRLDGIFAINEAQKAQILAVYRAAEEKIHMAGTGYNSRIFGMGETDVCRKKKKLTLIFAGKLSEKKGVMSLLRSLDYLEYAPRELELKLAGGYGNVQEYEKIRELAGLCRYPVRFLGKLTQRELAQEYRTSDVFVLPSFYEGMPLTMIEALACGDRVVVTDLPGIRTWMKEKVAHAPVVYVTPPGMYNTDEPLSEELPGFERELAAGIAEAAALAPGQAPDLSRITWENLCVQILKTQGEEAL